MYQPYPSSGQPAEPLRPAAPPPVRTAVGLMYAGAAVSAVQLIIGLALIIADVNAAARGRFLGHSLTAPQMRPLIITVSILSGVVVMALWLWVARASGRGRTWARVVSTVLFALATLPLLRPQPQGSPAGFGVMVLYDGVIVLSVAAWLAGAAAVWLLWRPASSAFFKRQGVPQAGRSAQPPSRIRSRPQPPRQV
jgi:hypothetical protein